MIQNYRSSSSSRPSSSSSSSSSSLLSSSLSVLDRLSNLHCRLPYALDWAPWEARSVAPPPPPPRDMNTSTLHWQASALPTRLLWFRDSLWGYLNNEVIPGIHTNYPLSPGRRGVQSGGGVRVADDPKISIEREIWEGAVGESTQSTQITIGVGCGIRRSLCVITRA